MKYACKKCWLCGGLVPYNFGRSLKPRCRLNGQIVIESDRFCRSCVTDDDVTAAKEECLKNRPEPSPVPPKWKVTLSALEKDKIQLEKDILRIKLEREKLWLEKEQKIPPFEEFPWGVNPNNAKSAMGDWIAETLCYSVGSRVLIGGKSDGLYKSYVDFCDKHNTRAFPLARFLWVIASECNWTFDVDDVACAMMCKGKILINICYRHGNKSGQRPPGFVFYHNDIFHRFAAAHGMSVSRFKEDWEAELFRGIVKPLSSPLKTDHANMQTLFCGKCGEHILVPEESMQIRWICMACGHENFFEVAQE